MADFTNVWVRIAPKDGNGILFAGFLYRPEFLLTGMSYAFQKAGQYELTVRFLNKDGEALAEATFPLVVEDSGSKFPKALVTGIVSGAVLGAWIPYLFGKYRRSK